MPTIWNSIKALAPDAPIDDLVQRGTPPTPTPIPNYDPVKDPVRLSPLWDTFKQGYRTWKQRYNTLARSPQAKKEWELLGERMLQEARATDPITMADIPGAGAMVPTAANLPKFLDKADKVYKQMREAGYSQPVAEAFAFIGTRYPRRTGLLGSILENVDLGPSLVGAADPSGTMLLGKNLRKDEVLDTVAHELQHFVDQTRGSKSKSYKWLEGPLSKLYPLWGGLSDLTQAAFSKTPLRHEGLGTRIYSMWPSERAAYKAEGTTQRALRKFDELLRNYRGK